MQSKVPIQSEVVCSGGIVQFQSMRIEPKFKYGILGPLSSIDDRLVAADTLCIAKGAIYGRRSANRMTKQTHRVLLGGFKEQQCVHNRITQWDMGDYVVLQTGRAIAVDVVSANGHTRWKNSRQ